MLLRPCFFLIGFLLSQLILAQPNYGQTKLVLLGTGTPNADPLRSGPSLAIVVNQHAYVVDCGPGVVRRAAAAFQIGVKGLQPAGLNRLFITHLHSDHTSGYPDFILTPAVLDRNQPLLVFGPKGLQSMTEHILQAYQQDIDIRLHGLEKGDSAGYVVKVKEIKEGVVYRDSNIIVKAFRVNHGSWPEAFGYRFETKDKVIVVSGDCTYSENLIRYAQNCDILVHEVYSMAGFAKRTPKWQTYHAAFHTSTAQLAEIANQVHPGLLVLTHELLMGSAPESLLQEIRDRYKGKVVFGNDLAVFE